MLNGKNKYQNNKKKKTQLKIIVTLDSDNSV